MSKGTKTKIISVRYGVLKNPNNRKIERAITKWTARGYELVQREESPAGCIGWGGKTHLTFIRRA